ncbi:MAG: hypothetical protein ACI867_001933, partial [Glaciecola sp.]
RGARQVHAVAGTFRATLAEADVRALIDLPPLFRRLDLRDDRVRLMTSTGLAVDVGMTVERGAIMLAPRANPLGMFLPMRHRIKLDELPAGATLARVVVRNGTLVASGPIDGSRLSGG